MLETGRATYTEPLALLFVPGGLGLLTVAHQTHRRIDFVVAGLTLGATAMTRIDGFLTLLPVIIYAALGLSKAVRARDRDLASETVLFVLGVMAAALVGLRDLQSLAPKYYHDLGADVRPLIGAALVLTFGAVAVVAAAARLARGPAGRSWQSPTNRHRLGVLSLLAGGLLTVALSHVALRRLWFIGHQHNEAGVSRYIEFLQKSQGLPLDGDRTYSELTVTWLV